MLHAEPIHKVSVVIKHRVAIASIEIIIHQPIANHDVLRVNAFILLLQLQQCLQYQYPC